MKLAFCLFNYFPHGGLQRDFLAIAVESLRRGHQVDVFTREWLGDAPALLNIQLLPNSASQNHTRNKIFAKTCHQYFQATPYDRVVGFNKMPNLDIYYAADVCYQARMRQRFALNRWSSRYRQLIAMEESVFKQGKPTQILLIADKEKSAFINYYQTEPERFHLLPPGINKEKFTLKNQLETRQAMRQQTGYSEAQSIILMVGSGFKTKGLDRAIRALAGLPALFRERTVLWVVGADHAEKFERQALRLDVGVQVQFFGGRDNVADYMAAADLLIHPAYHENTGTVLLEAMVVGLPVLTTDVCGYAHYVEKANAGCVLESPFEQEQLNTCLQMMLSSPNRKQWQENGRLFAQREEIDSLVNKAVDLIEKMDTKR